MAKSDAAVRQRLARAEEEARRGGANRAEMLPGISMRESAGALSTVDNHPSDLGETTFARERDLGILGAARHRMREVRDARRRLDEGTYGRCTSCGGAVGAARLEAEPWAALCLACQEREDLRDRASRDLAREAQAEAIGRGIAPDPGLDPVGYDGEDAVQEALRPGSSSSPQDAPPARRADRALPDPYERVGAVTDAELVADPRSPRPGSGLDGADRSADDGRGGGEPGTGGGPRP